MQQQGCLPVETCRTLASDPLSHNSALTRRQPKDRQERLRRTGSSDWSFGSAPSRGFLAVDLITIKHEGEGGVGRHYSSSTRGVCWGHTFTSSVLQDPYLPRTDSLDPLQPVPRQISGHPRVPEAHPQRGALQPRWGLWQGTNSAGLRAQRSRSRPVFWWRSPGLSWRASHCLASAGLGSAMVTGLDAIVA